MEHRHARPARRGLTIPMPERPGSFLPAEGEIVRVSTYWLRREADGDVVLTAPPDEKRAAKGAKD